MTIRPFVPWPDKRLATPAEPVEAVTDETRAIWADMIDTMEAMPGVGLAAPQIGVMQALAVVDASQERGQAVRLANPRVVWASDELRSHVEGSPNLPGFSAKLLRPRHVRVAFLNAKGEEEEREFEGLWSTSVQHQIDHLAGRMYFENLSRTRRDMFLRKARKAVRS